MLSVVTPFDGSAPLRPLLESLGEQTRGRSDVEVLICTTEEAHAAAVEASRGVCPVRILVSRTTDPVAHSGGLLRNDGIERANGDRLVFLDSDAIPNPKLVNRYASWHELDPSVVVCGGWRDLAPRHHELLESGPSWDDLAALADADYREGSSDPLGAARWDQVYGGNFSAPTSLVREVGGFDTSGYRCHDLDLGYRLQAGGARLVLDLDCAAIHLEHPRTVFYRALQVSGLRRLAEKYPELRETVEKRSSAIERYRKSVGECAERRFAEFCRRCSHVGVRAGSVLITTQLTQLQAALGLGGLHAHQTHVRGAELWRLRLHRDCWDYGVLLRQVFPVDPLFTVIVPVRNGEQHVRDAVASVLQQSFQEFEVIVVDDGSTDSTAQRIRPFLSLPWVSFVSHEGNRGLSAALNTGLSRARGAYVIQLDADDVLLPGALEKIAGVVESDPTIDAAYGAPLVLRDREVQKESFLPSWSPRDLLLYDNLQAPRVYRRESLIRVGGWSEGDAYSGRYFEDRWTMYRVATGRKVRQIDGDLYMVRTRPNSLSRGNGLDAAAAKLGILLLESGLRGFLTDFAVSGGFLRGEFSSFPKERDGTVSWSVVIPFERGLAFLQLALASWMSSDLDLNRDEIIVVAYGAALTASAQLSSIPSEVRVHVPDACGNPAEARNEGARIATKSRLFFSDSDHCVHPATLAAHEWRSTQRDSVVFGGVLGLRSVGVAATGISSHEKGRALIGHRHRPQFGELVAAWATGREMPLLDEVEASEVYAQLSQTAFVPSWQRQWLRRFVEFGLDLEDCEGRWLRAGSGSMSVRKQTFDELGGFNTEYDSMEDWEFTLRCEQMGVPIAFNCTAHPIHLLHARDPSRQLDNAAAAAKLRRDHWAPVLALASSSSRPPGAELVLDSGKSPYAGSPAAPISSVLGLCALSYDDGPRGPTTQQILSELRRADVLATFFVLGSRVQEEPRLMRELVESGHEVGIHGWDHRRLTDLSVASVCEMLRRTRDRIERVTGQRSTLFRPPYGLISEGVLEAVDRLGLRLVGWHSSSCDWRADFEARDSIARLASSGVDGRVVLLHDSAPQETVVPTTRWLASDLNACLRFVTCSQFLDACESSEVLDGLRWASPR